MTYPLPQAFFVAPPPFPAGLTNGQIYAWAEDASSFYVAGNFTRVCAEQTPYINVLNTGTSNSELYAPGVTIGSILQGFNGAVYSMQLSGNSLYCGGAFTTYKGKLAQYIAKIDLVTGLLDPNFIVSTAFSSIVNSIILSGGYLYCGGAFTSFKGTTRQYVAKITADTATLDDTFDSTLGFNNSVNSMALNGTDLYLGGQFTTYKGPARQYVAKIDATTASLDATFDSGTGFNSTVYSILFDTGNIYVGGDFATYKGTARLYLAKINSTTADLDTTFNTATGPSSAVYSLAISGSALYCGGAFSQYKLVNRQYVAKVNASTAALDTTFDSATGFNGSVVVYSLILDGNNLYCGGNFTTYKSINRQNIAKINATTAAIDSTFDASLGFNASVRCLIRDGTKLYCGGTFWNFKGTASQYVAKISKFSFTPDPSFNAATGFNGIVQAMVFDGTFLYCGGQFGNYKGTNRLHVAKINATTAGLDTTFDSSVGFNSTVMALALEGNDLYCGGNFTTHGTNSRSNLAKLNATTAALADGYSYGVDNSVNALKLEGDYLYVGGSFITSDVHNTQYITTIDRETGDTLDVAKLLSRFSDLIYTIVPSGNSLFVGGSFTTYSGIAAMYIAKVDLTTGQLDSAFSTATGFNNPVASLALSGNALYAGGSFTSYKGTTRQRVAKINATTAALDTSFDSTVGFNNTVWGLRITDSGLCCHGAFNNYKGYCRGSIAKLDLNTAALLHPTYSYGVNSIVYAAEPSGDSLYLGGDFTGCTNNASYAVVLDSTTASSTPTTALMANFNSTVHSHFVDGDYLFAAGAFTEYKGVTASRIAKVNLLTGDLDSTFNSSTAFNNIVYDIKPSGTHIFCAGNFSNYKGVARQYIAKIDSVSGILDTTFDTAIGFDATVLTMALSGSDLYCGGSFNKYKNAYRNRLAKIDTTSGNVDWGTARGINNIVRTIVPADGLFIGGDFTGVDQPMCAGVALLNSTSGTTVDLSTILGRFNGAVYTMTVDGDSVYVGGEFITYEDTDTRYLAKLSLIDGSLDPTFRVGTNLPTNGYVRSITVDDTAVYIAGNFTAYSGVGRQYIAKLDKTDATLNTTFNSNSGFNNIVRAMALVGGDLYCGGEFTSYKGVTRQRVAKVNATTAAVDTSFAPVNGAGSNVFSMAVSGSEVYIGGQFTTYSGVNRLYLAKLDSATAALDTTFDVSTGFNSSIVYALALSGTALYCGGSFTSYKGTNRQRVIKLNATTAALDTTFDSSTGFTNNNVQALLLDGTSLYCAGNFTLYKGTVRQYIAKLNPTNATLDTTFNTASGFNNDAVCLALYGSAIVCGGWFSYLQRTVPQAYLSKLSPTTFTQDSSFNIGTGFNSVVNTLAPSGSAIYAGGSFTTYKGVTRQRIAKVSSDGTLDTTFDSSTGFSSTLNSLLVSGNSIYCGGAFNTYKGTTRGDIAKIDSTTAALDTTFNSFNYASNTYTINSITPYQSDTIICGGSFPWYNYPVLTGSRLGKVSEEYFAPDSIFNTTTGCNNSVRSILPTNSGVYIGGLFTTYNSAPAVRLAKVDPNTAALDTSFDTSLAFNSTVYSLYLADDGLYCGGAFTTYKNIAAQSLVRIDPTVASLDTSYNTTKYLSGYVYTIVPSGTSFILGGNFRTNIKGITRQRIAKINKSEFKTDLTFDSSQGFSGPVNSIDSDEDYVYCGGNLSSYKAYPTGNVGKLDKITAAWDTNVIYGLNGLVNDIEYQYPYLYVGGQFTEDSRDLGGTYFTALNAVSGTVTSLGRVLSGFSSTVRVVLPDGDDLYVGGDFTSWHGLSCLYIAKFNMVSGTLYPEFNSNAGFNGGVYSIALDGGSLYVGGNFTAYSGVSRASIAKINATTAALDGTFNSSPGFNSSSYVYSLAVSGNSLYCGGSFTSYKSTVRQYIAKLNTTDASLDAVFDTSTGFDSAVTALLLSGSSLYVGGGFGSYKSVNRRRLAKINTISGTVDMAFDTQAGFNGTVQTISQAGSELYVGGDFTSYKGYTASRICKVNSTTASFISSSNFGVSNTINSIAYDGSSTLYIGGNFLYVNLKNNIGLNVFDTTTAKSNIYNDILNGFNSAVTKVVVSGDYLYAGGLFTAYKGDPRLYLAKIHIPTGDLDTTFNVSTGFDGQVKDLVLSGSAIYCAGSFSQYKGVGRNCIAKLDGTTAALNTSFTSGFQYGNHLNTIALSGSSLFCGGNFSLYSGTPRNKLVKINTNNGSLDSTFDSSIGFDSFVNDIVVSGDNIYCGGEFTTYNGYTRSRLVSIDATTGQVDHDRYYGVDSPVNSIAIDNSSLYIGGNFNFTDVEPFKGVAALDLGSGVADPIARLLGNFDGTVYTTIVSGDTLYAAGNFTSYRGTARNRLAKIDLITGDLDLTFDTSIGFNDVVYKIVLSGNDLYCGGGFVQYSGEARNKLAKIDRFSGTLDSTFDSASGFGINNVVYDLQLIGQTLVVGGNLLYYKDAPIWNLVSLDPTTAALNTSCVYGVDSSVRTIIPAEEGSFFVGGYFTSTATSGNFIRYAAAIDSVTASSLPISNVLGNFDNTVWASIVASGYLYVAGDFATYSGVACQRLAKIDLTTGQLDPTFDTTTGFNTAVRCLYLDDGYLYCGGNFSSYKGTTRAFLAKINATSATLDPTFDTSTGPNSIVRCLYVSGTSLFFGGNFSSYKGTGRLYVAKISSSTAAIDGTFNTATGFSDGVYAMVPSGTSIFCGGNFTSYKSTVRQCVAKINSTTAALDTVFDLSSGFTNAVYALALSGTALYCGGSFSQYRSVNRFGIAKLNTTSGALDSDFNSSNYLKADSSAAAVWSIALKDTDIYLGGGFTSYSTTNRQNLVKLNATTAALDTTFDTSLGANSTIYTMTFSGSTLCLGGNFSGYFHGQTRREKIAKFNLADFTPDSTFDTSSGIARVSSSTAVWSLEKGATGLYIGGTFGSYKGVTRNNLVKVDTISGTIINEFETTIAANATIYAMYLDTDGLYIGGDLTVYKNYPRKYLSKINIDTAELILAYDTSTGFNQASVFSLNKYDSMLLCAGSFTGYGARGCRGVAKLSLEDFSSDRAFNITTGPNSQLNTVLVDGDSAYIGGYFTTYNGVPRLYVAKIDANTAVLDSTFNTTSGLNGAVFGMAVSGANLFVAGASTLYAGDSIPMRGVAKLNSVTFEADPLYQYYNYQTSVNSLALYGNQLLVGGAFSYINTRVALRITKLNRADLSVVTDFTPNAAANQTVLSLMISGPYLYIGGSFSQYSGTFYDNGTRISKDSAILAP